MIEFIDVIWLILFGLAGGIIAGMLGIGGGVIYVLIFTTYLPVLLSKPISGDLLIKLIIANSAFALIFAGISGCIKQYKIDNFYPNLVILIGIPGIIGAVLSTYILSFTTEYSQETFTIVFSLLLLPVILRMIYQKKISIHNVSSIYPPGIFLLIGLVSGSATAFSGLGGGFIIVPVLTGLLNFPIKKTVSISLGVIALVSIGLSIYNVLIFNSIDLEIPFSMGPILLPMVFPVVIGVIAGAPLGVKLAHKLPSTYLRIFFVSFCCLVILYLYLKFYLQIIS